MPQIVLQNNLIAPMFSDGSKNNSLYQLIDHYASYTHLMKPEYLLINIALMYGFQQASQPNKMDMLSLWWKSEHSITLESLFNPVHFTFLTASISPSS